MCGAVLFLSFFSLCTENRDVHTARCTTWNCGSCPSQNTKHSPATLIPPVLPAHVSLLAFPGRRARFRPHVRGCVRILRVYLSRPFPFSQPDAPQSGDTRTYGSGPDFCELRGCGGTARFALPTSVAAIRCGRHKTDGMVMVSDTRAPLKRTDSRSFNMLITCLVYILLCMFSCVHVYVCMCACMCAHVCV